MNRTKIEWTDWTWNPIHARRRDGKLRSNGRAMVGNFCTKISPGCANCYASTINHVYGNGYKYAAPNLENVEFYLDEKELKAPARLKPQTNGEPWKIFTGDMFDLFHEHIPREMIEAVLVECERLPWHVFQLLTKRAARMESIFSFRYGNSLQAFAPRNVHLGVSVEDKKRADERIPLLQMTPAVVRFLSIEPQLEDINLVIDSPEVGSISLLRGFDGCDPPIPGIDWVICGGESGHGARPFRVEWAESLLAQCRAAGVPFFMKQFGARPTATIATGQAIPLELEDRKGGDMAEWPESLRVREWPAVKGVVRP